VDKVKVIMKALAGVCPQVSTMGLFIVPWLIGGRRFKRRKDVNKAGMISSFFEDLSDTIFFAKVLSL
jgi:hypothetical protein